MILARSKETPNKRGQSLNRHSTEHNNRAEQGILFATRYIWSSRSLRKRNTEDCFGILSRRWNNGILLLLSLHSCAFWLMSYVRDELMFTFPTLIRPNLSLSSPSARSRQLLVSLLLTSHLQRNAPMAPHEPEPEALAPLIPRIRGQ